MPLRSIAFCSNVIVQCGAMGANLSNLPNKHFDLIVIGGGITGCGIAREARLRGLSVALFEKGDFAGGTSGKTSSLAHGGIRYLAQGAFGLVAESIEERHKLLQMAPHLVSPLPFLFPIYEGRSRGKTTVQLGMTLYDKMAGKNALGAYRFLSPAQTLFLEPNLSGERLRGAALFWDCQMDDARLCLSTLLSAQEMGAEVYNYTEVIGLIRHGKNICGVRIKEVASGRAYDVDAKVVINAAGVWADSVCKMEGNYSERVRPTKGIHLVLPKVTEKHAIVLPGQEGRIFFVMPWRDHTLLGTTDSDYSGSLDQVTSDDDEGEVKSLINETAAFLPIVAQEKVLARFAALRPLVHGGGANPLAVSRKEKIEWTKGGMLVVIGGKFTLFRKIAERVIDAVIKAHPAIQASKRPETEPLIYGAPTVPIQAYIQQESKRKDLPVSGALLEHLIRSYGTKYQAVLDCANNDPALLKPMTALGYPILAEVSYAVLHEHATHLSDFMLRRTRLAHGRYRNSLPLIQKIVKRMGDALGWRSEQMLKELQLYLTAGL
ncbi:MAG: glycerol-3-phosphate dehydrogenase/oxidase [Nitrospirota bacterium]